MANENPDKNELNFVKKKGKVFQSTESDSPTLPNPYAK